MKHRKLLCQMGPVGYWLSLHKEYLLRDIKNLLSREHFATKIDPTPLPCLVKGHTSLLLRRLHGMFRVKGRSWWAEELPSDQEYAEALKSLERVNWKVDCILTHCGPTGIIRKINPSYGNDRLTDFLEKVNQRCRFAYWFFGHYHDNRIIDDKYILQWEQISGLEV